jgi:prepilin-type processing-associated H-X9-DG protein
LFFDAKRNIPWTKPQDIEYSADKDVPTLGGYEPAGFNVALCDGSVRLFSKDIDEKILRAIISRNGNEVVQLPARIRNPQFDRPLKQ